MMANSVANEICKYLGVTGTNDLGKYLSVPLLISRVTKGIHPTKDDAREDQIAWRLKDNGKCTVASGYSKFAHGSRVETPLQAVRDCLVARNVWIEETEGSLARIVRELLARDWHVKTMFTSRTATMAADSMAALGRNVPLDLRIYDVPLKMIEMEIL
ncbi:hypothetical protein Gogos_020067 [Gossypium gossypioides]|uniref:Uncharacterized protein n=1 Tax=Gossypium gossypioides TaxID=34282 RepID=A0A7J9CYR1_GOSGO|nr:hypothetical protein [Gossypium gossypioides]